ncbi:MAG: hypothetical protein IMY70_04125 [Bacteroidetes bacterium]|nr:hypothetical protein [Bacteroidota bacterium]
MDKKIKYILFSIILLLLVLPAIQNQFHLFSIKPLKGDFVPAPKPELNANNWFNGEYQAKYDDFLEQHIGLRSSLVRLNNQIDFSLFKKPNAEGIVIGKKRHMYEADYIRAYLGNDFVGKSIIDKKLGRFKFLQQHLKDEYDIDLILVFEPGKASFYPEYIPDHYNISGKTITNYEYYTQKADELDIRHIDFNKYYKTLKNTARYPIYTKNGVHWSIYGMTFAADSIINYIEYIRQIDMPEMYLDRWELSVIPRRTDNDVSKTMNLFWEPPLDTMAYPVYSYEVNEKKDRPMVLVIGDSFYWNIFNTGLPKNLFGNEAFWYFYSKVYPDNYIKPVNVGDLDIKSEIEKQDVVFLMVTERFMYIFDWGFTDDLYELYAPTSLWDKLYRIRIGITKDNEWFNHVINKARSKGLSLEEMMYLDAKYIMMMNDLDNYLALFGHEYFEEKIKSDPNWYNSIKEKAAEQKVTVEEMLRQNADYLFRKNNPGAFEKYYAIKQIENNIRADSALFGHIKEKAKNFRLTIDEMIRCDAEFAYEERNSDQ